MKKNQSQENTNKNTAKNAAKNAGNQSNQCAASQFVRIIAGTLKQKKIPILSMGDVDDLRPTPERLRESLFNSLGQNLRQQRVLDLFAGSAALSFEAYSRGASVLSIEYSLAIFKEIIKTQKALNVASIDFSVLHANAFDYLRATKSGLAVADFKPNDFDIILLDPPYRLAAIPEILQIIVDKILNLLNSLNSGSLNNNYNNNLQIYCEHNQALDFAEIFAEIFKNIAENINIKYSIKKTWKAGQIHAYLLLINY